MFLQSELMKGKIHFLGQLQHNMSPLRDDLCRQLPPTFSPHLIILPPPLPSLPSLPQRQHAGNNLLYLQKQMSSLQEEKLSERIMVRKCACGDLCLFLLPQGCCAQNPFICELFSSCDIKHSKGPPQSSWFAVQHTHTHIQIHTLFHTKKNLQHLLSISFTHFTSAPDFRLCALILRISFK